MATRQQNWAYYGLLGHTRRSIIAMRAVCDNPLASDLAKNIAANIAKDLQNLQEELRTNKRKDPQE